MDTLPIAQAPNSASDLALQDRTVGTIVAEDYRRARILKKYGIEFCCGGGIPLTEAAQRKGLDVAEIVDALDSVKRDAVGPAAKASRWSNSFLIDYIVETHHSWVRETIPSLRAFTTKVARVHGEAVPELREIATAFESLATEMENHMAFEETVLFPAIKAGEDGAAKMIAQAESEHQDAGGLMETIRNLTNDFTPPDWACATYRASFTSLAEFEDDLHTHVHLENNVLFPRIKA